MGVPRFVPGVMVLALVVLCGTADAAMIIEVTGMVKLNGEAVSGPETPFPEGGRLEVIGDGSSATIVTGSGDRIVLDPGTQIVFSQMSEDGEIYEVMSGSFRARLSPKTIILLPNDGRLQAAEGGVELAVESRENGTRTALAVNEGGAILKSGEQFTTKVGAGQSVVTTFDRQNPRKLGFETGPNNEGSVVVLDQATPDLEIEVGVPPATTGEMAAVEGNTKTKIENSLDSSKEGSLGIVSRVKGDEVARGEVGPGVFAFVDHATGAIELQYVEIDFQVLKRAIGLTSEFQTLAVSNFTGVRPPNPGGSPPPRNGETVD